MNHEGTIHTLETFAQAVRDYLLANYEALDIEINKVSKNNGIMLTGLCIREKGDSLCPNIYLDDFYESYRNGKPVEELADEVIRVFRERRQPEQFDVCFLHRYDTVKDKIVYRLVNFAKNAQRLQDMPYVKYMNLAVIFAILLDETEDGAATITITNQMMQLWNTSTEELYAVAHENTAKRFPALFQRLEEMLFEMMGDTAEEMIGEHEPFPIYVATNCMKLHGAAVVLYEDQLKTFSEQIGGDYFLLPSSIHEMLLVPVTDSINSADDLREMVVDVNASCLAEEDILSDVVYRYFSNENCVRIVA